MAHHDHNGREPSARLTGYLPKKEKLWWNEELERVAQLEGLRNVGMGTLFARISKAGLPLDIASLSKLKAIKRPREQDPARR